METKCPACGSPKDPSHMSLVLFSRPMCGGCHDLKAYLDEHQIKYEEVDASTPDGLSYMYIHEIFVRTFPALCFGNKLLKHDELLWKPAVNLPQNIPNLAPGPKRMMMRNEPASNM